MPAKRNYKITGLTEMNKNLFESMKGDFEHFAFTDHLGIETAIKFMTRWYTNHELILFMVLYMESAEDFIDPVYHDLDMDWWSHEKKQ